MAVSMKIIAVPTYVNFIKTALIRLVAIHAACMSFLLTLNILQIKALKKTIWQVIICNLPFFYILSNSRENLKSMQNI